MESETDWNALWASLQEVGSNLSPVLDVAPVPRWALQLRRALDRADDMVTRNALTEEEVTQ